MRLAAIESRSRESFKMDLDRDMTERAQEVIRRLAAGHQFEDSDLTVGSVHFMRWTDDPAAEDAVPVAVIDKMREDGLIFFNPDTRRWEPTDKARDFYGLDRWEEGG